MALSVRHHNRVAGMANLDTRRRQLLVEQLAALERAVDVILIDCGAGIDHNVSAFAAAAHTHDSSHIVSGALDDARLAANVTRDAEVLDRDASFDGFFSRLRQTLDPGAILDPS